MRYQLQHGKEFGHLLEARDQLLEHSFEFKIYFDDKDLPIENQHVSKSSFYQNVKKAIKHFLVEAVSNVSSAGFNFLCAKHLEEGEAKEFSAKNIMLNTQAIFREAILEIGKHPILKDRVDAEELRDYLVIEIDNILSNILLNLADSYPQAPAVGGTPRMREAINDIDRTDDE
jgi:hypothetical protein